MKRENTSKLLSNLFVAFSGESISFCQILSNVFIMFSDLTVKSITFIFIDFIYTCTCEVSKILAYKLQDILLIITLLTNVGTKFSGIIYRA